MEPSKDYLFKYKGFYFSLETSPEYLDSLEDFEIKDSDIFIATYPKSGKNAIVSKGVKNLPLLIHLTAEVPRVVSFAFRPKTSLSICSVALSTNPA